MVGDMLRVNPKKRLYHIRQVMCYPWIRDEWQRLLYKATTLPKTHAALEASLPALNAPTYDAKRMGTHAASRHPPSKTHAPPTTTTCPLMHESLRHWLQHFLTSQAQKPWPKNHNYHQAPPMYPATSGGTARASLTRHDTNDTASGSSQHSGGRGRQGTNGSGLRRLKTALQKLFRQPSAHPTPPPRPAAAPLQGPHVENKDIDAVMIAAT